MAKRRGTVPDDRGKRVEVVRSADVREDPELFDALMRVQETSHGLNQALSLRHGLLLLAGVAITTTVLVVANSVPGLPPMAAPFVIIGLCVAGAFLFRDVGNDPVLARRAETLLRIGRCPACGYRLENLPPEPDGTIVCPECAAAWKVERVHFAKTPARDLPPRAELKGDTPPIVGAWARGFVRAPSVVDDRNRSVPMVDLALSTLDPAIEPQRAARLRAEVRTAGRADRIGCAGIGLVFILLFMGLQAWRLATLRSGVGALPGAFVLLCIPAWGLGVWRMWSGRSWVGQKDVVKYLKAAAVCPSCAKDLRGVAVGEDRCTVCPGCAAAWKL